MIEEVANEYANYISNAEIQAEVKNVQDIIDNMITRLEELSSVLQIIKSKNKECSASVTGDITKYRAEVTILRKKVTVLTELLCNLQNNVNALEKYVERAEAYFGITIDNRFKSFLKPFLMRKDQESSLAPVPADTYHFKSVLDHFESQLDKST